MDDLESLVFSMWYVAGVTVGKEPEGYVLCGCKKMGTAEARMQVSRNNFRMKIIEIIVHFHPNYYLLFLKKKKSEKM